jgi:hypothetical protein
MMGELLLGLLLSLGVLVVPLALAWWLLGRSQGADRVDLADRKGRTGP